MLCKRSPLLCWLPLTSDSWTSLAKGYFKPELFPAALFPSGYRSPCSLGDSRGGRAEPAHEILTTVAPRSARAGVSVHDPARPPGTGGLGVAMMTLV